MFESIFLEKNKISLILLRNVFWNFISFKNICWCLKNYLLAFLLIYFYFTNMVDCIMVPRYILYFL